jgi:DNA-directed RNA polymerase subunit RPC12/RpoP
MAAVRKVFCRNCDKETLQNPIKRGKPTDEQSYRCTECGHPLRLGGMAKNYGVKVGGKIMFFGAGQPVTR